MAVAALFFSAMAVCVKLVPRLPVIQVVFLRAFFAGILCFATIKAQGTYLWGYRRGLLVWRGIFGTGGLVAYFTTLHYLPLATATVLQYLSPIFTAVIGALFLGEAVGVARWLCFTVSFCGVAVMKGFDPSVSWLQLGVGVFGALSAALAYSCIARLKTTEDPQVIMFYFPLITCPLTLPFTIAQWVPPTGKEWLILLATGAFVQAAQYFMTLSYQHGRPGAVSIVSYLGVVLALFWDVTLFQAEPSSGALLGIALVVGGVIASALLHRETPARNSDKIA